MHLVCPLKCCIRVVFIFSWDGCNTQEKWKTKVMRKFGAAGGWGGGEGANKVHCGKCGIGVVVFWSNSLLCCLSRTVLPYFLRKNTRNLFIIWTIALYLLLLVYIYLKHDGNFTILGHSLNTREFVLKCSVTIRKIWPHSNCNQHVNVVHPLFFWPTPVA